MLVIIEFDFYLTINEQKNEDDKIKKSGEDTTLCYF